MTGWMPWERQEEAIARHHNHAQHKQSKLLVSSASNRLLLKEKFADAKTS